MTTADATIEVPGDPQLPGSSPGHLASPSAQAPGEFLVTCRHCDSPTRARGLCTTHLARQTHGKPMAAPIRRSPPSFARLNHPITYDGAHSRCKSLWGSASHYPCITCGGKSQGWAYDGTDPSELIGQSTGRDHRDGVEMHYSIWPEFFMPMCRKCHAAFDHPDGEPVGVNPDW